MLFWWQRIVVMNKKVKGWELHASHFTGQDLPTCGWISDSAQIGPLVQWPDRGAMAERPRTGSHWPLTLLETHIPCSPSSSAGSLLVIPTLIGVAVAVFFLIRVMPGDVVVVKLRADGANVTEETIQAERKRLGLDKPLYVQFVDYMLGLAVGDLGKSLWTGESVAKEIAIRFPVSFQVAIMATLIAVFIAIPLGTLSALYRDTWIDWVVRILAVSGLAIPSFWLGMLIILGAAVAVQLAAEDRLRLDLQGSRHEPLGADLAGAVGRLSLCGGGDAHDALGTARSSARGLYPHRQGEGPLPEPDHAAARAAQRHAAGHHRHRPRVRLPDRRPRRDGAGVQSQRHRQTVRRCDNARRLQPDPGPRAADRRRSSSSSI